MKPASIFASVCLASLADAVNMSRYRPEHGVEAEFEPYIKELYRQTELKMANETFYNFFLPPGTLGIVGMNYTGQTAIIREKRELLSPTDNHFWDHFPNKTTVFSESATTKTYNIDGIIDNIFIGQPYNNCSAAYFKSQFTLHKEANGSINFTPHSGNLIFYNDYVITPFTVPTDIQCAT